MKSLQEFVLEAESDVYVVYFGDGIMQNFYYDENEAKAEVKKLNDENADAKATYKKEKKSAIEK